MTAFLAVIWTCVGISGLLNVTSAARDSEPRARLPLILWCVHVAIAFGLAGFWLGSAVR